MKKFFVRAALFTLGWAGLSINLAAAPASASAAPAYDYAKPTLLTGTLYAIGSDRSKILYTFRRTASRDGDLVHVDRQFLLTNGVVAAEEKVLYKSNRLVSFEMRDFQAKVSGAIHIGPDPDNPGRQKIFISFTHGLNPSMGRAHTLQPDTLIDDTLYPFMTDHWGDLMRGRTVRFHFVSLDWERTFEFGLTKTGEFVQNGRPVVQLTMKPASLFISAFVRPIVFTAQANGSHLILSYVGRTTPRIRKGSSWKELDAETVFDYPATESRK